ncbi:AMP-binding protein [Rhodococcus opacus]|uniref:AMP-binding protein n=1 Tax=Rhodococcus opacus TaxID=37919 RepID=UPI000C1FD53B|nr:AMP-binding protein [Rhodococcus opacus]MDV6245119.1 AMP-binding protein [Rhodococcus opacus]
MTPDHRSSSTLAGARSISVAEIKARLAAMFADDNPDTPPPALPAPPAASELSPTTS